MKVRTTIILACTFSTLVAILTAFNSWSMNEISTDAYSAGQKNSDNNDTYHISGTADAIRGVNITFCILSILFMGLCIYGLYFGTLIPTTKVNIKEILKGTSPTTKVNIKEILNKAI